MASVTTPKGYIPSERMWLNCLSRVSLLVAYSNDNVPMEASYRNSPSKSELSSYLVYNIPPKGYLRIALAHRLRLKANNNHVHLAPEIFAFYFYDPQIT